MVFLDYGMNFKDKIKVHVAKSTFAYDLKEYSKLLAQANKARHDIVKTQFNEMQRTQNLTNKSQVHSKSANRGQILQNTISFNKPSSNSEVVPSSPSSKQPQQRSQQLNHKIHALTILKDQVGPY